MIKILGIYASVVAGALIALSSGLEFTQFHNNHIFTTIARAVIFLGSIILAVVIFVRIQKHKRPGAGPFS